MKIELEDLKKVKLEPTDTLVFTARTMLSKEQFDFFHRKLTGFFPNNKILILDQHIELKVVSTRPVCEAMQCSDQMTCVRCSLNWDVNDSHPPLCPKLDQDAVLKSSFRRETRNTGKFKKNDRVVLTKVETDWSSNYKIGEQATVWDDMYADFYVIRFDDGRKLSVFEDKIEKA